MTVPRPHPFARTDTSRWAQWWWTTDRWLLGATGALIVLGVLLQFGTSPAAAARLGIASPFHFALRQCAFAALGVVVVLCTSVLRPRGVRRVAFFVYLVAIVSMMALPFLGHNAKGATRWVEFAGFALQPSEFMKPALLVLVAWMFAEAQKGEIPGVSIAFGLYLVAVVLLLLEPDIGQTALITAAFGAAFWVAGVPIGWIVGMGVTAIVGLGSTPFIFPHVATRLNLFLAPKPTEPGQVQRAAEAIAAGGGFGRGPGEGIMKVQIPAAHHPLRRPRPARPLPGDEDLRSLRAGGRRGSVRHGRHAGLHQYRGQPGPGAHQGHDLALHILWRLLHARHGPDNGHGPGADPASAERLWRR
jgi:cell division protein FtsW